MNSLSQEELDHLQEDIARRNPAVKLDQKFEFPMAWRKLCLSQSTINC
jgi:hypothetical protein